MPEVPQVKTCCLCCTTEVGSKIIGWWLLVSGILQSINWIVQLIGSLGDKHHGGDKADAIVELIFSLIVVFLGLYLLIGTYKRNMRYVKCWLTVATIYLIILAIGIIGLLISGQMKILNQLINFVIDAYFIVVVYSFYRENLNTAPSTY